MKCTIVYDKNIKAISTLSLSISLPGEYVSISTDSVIGTLFVMDTVVPGNDMLGILVTEDTVSSNKTFIACN